MAQTFRRAPEAEDEGFDWTKLAAGLGGLATIFGSKNFGPQQAKMYRDWIKLVARQAPRFQAQGADWLPKLLRGSWWHGTRLGPDEILERGFDPSKVGYGGTRFGEPAGVSLSASPTVSGNFSNDLNLLRVWPNVDPKSVLPAWSDEAGDIISNAYLRALDVPVHGPKGRIGDLLEQYWEGNLRSDPSLRESPAGFLRNFSTWSDDARKLTAAFNREMSEALRKQGVEGLLYSPHRYNEFELRVLNPLRAVPIEKRVLQRGPMEALRERKDKALYRGFQRAVPGSKSSLSEHYSDRNLAERALKTRRFGAAPEMPGVPMSLQSALTDKFVSAAGKKPSAYKQYIESDWEKKKAALSEASKKDWADFDKKLGHPSEAKFDLHESNMKALAEQLAEADKLSGETAHMSDYDFWKSLGAPFK